MADIQETGDTGGINIEEASTQIGLDLFGSGEDPAPPDLGDAPAPVPRDGDAPAPPSKDFAPRTSDASEPVPAVKPAPQSWAKDAHELWAKIPPDAQAQIEKREKQMLDGISAYKQYSDVGKSFSDIIQPYTAEMTAQGLDAPKVLQVMLNAHYKLSHGQPHERHAFLAGIARSYGLDMAQSAKMLADNPLQAPDPRDERLAKLEGALLERQREQLQQKYQETEREVGDFMDAKDDKGNLKHPYFEEVGNDIVTFLREGFPIQEAYERAVRSNPTTFAKETARLKAEVEASLRSKSKAEVEAARRATQGNVRGRDTRRAPTEPVGTIEDTIRETYKEIQSRATH